MREYSLDKSYLLVGTSASPKGMQTKYKKDGYYYKVNKSGNEGYTEYLVSKVLQSSSLRIGEYVIYEYCVINGQCGCRSKDFLRDGEIFITMDDVYAKVTGNFGFADFLFNFRTANERLEYILDVVEQLGVVREEYRQYLNVMLQFDMLILNKDRHAQNYGIIYDSKYNLFRVPPLFDNGLALDTDRVGDNTSCTISGSYSEQVVAFGFPVKPCFDIDYWKLEQALYDVETAYGLQHELIVLRNQLDLYAYLFKK